MTSDQPAKEGSPPLSGGRREAAKVDICETKRLDSFNVRRLEETRALHPSFLRSLDIMGVSLGGIVIMDQLVVAKEFQSYLADYTARVSPRSF